MTGYYFFTQKDYYKFNIDFEKNTNNNNYCYNSNFEFSPVGDIKHEANSNNLL